MDALNLCLHIVEASNGCLHLIQLKQMGNMTHLLTCAHNHKILVYFSQKNREVEKMQLKIARRQAMSVEMLMLRLDNNNAHCGLGKFFGASY